ncbi:MAG: hypothetical protein WD208_01320 [Dehalococcoidia bacterium]
MNESVVPVAVRAAPSISYPGNTRPGRHVYRHGKRAPGSRLRRVVSDGEWMDVASIEDIWKVNDQWWRGMEQEVERVYYKLVFANSQHITVYHDLIGDRWFRQTE